MASTAALTAAVEGLTNVVSEVVSEVQGTDDQAAIDQAVSAIESAVSELKGVIPAKAPVVSSVSPDAGSSAGGESVVISGSGLSGTTGVRFGSADASFTVDSDSQVTAQTPAVEASSVEVVVSAPSGSSAPVGFTFS